MSRWIVTAGLSAVLIAGCADGDDAANDAATVETSDSETTAPATTAPDTTTPDTTTPATTTRDTASSSTQPPPDGDLAAAIGVAVQLAMRGSTVPPPDPACFAAGVADFDTATQEAAARLIDEPFAWPQIGRQQRLPLASTLVGCADLDGVLTTLALGTVNALDPGCVVATWRDVLTAEMIASSLATGTGLDDLPPDAVAALVAGARPCLPDDPAWWVDDVALELDGTHGMSFEQATCVAQGMVDGPGVDAVLERRILTVPLLTLADADLATLQTTCGVTITLPPLGLGAPGACVADVFDPDQQPDLVACDQPHNAEVLTTVDLAADFPAWPGLTTVDDRAGAACRDVANRSIPDPDDIGLLWLVPTRQVWLRGGRTATCVIGPIDGSSWTAPSGITVPPTSVAGE